MTRHFKLCLLIPGGLLLVLALLALWYFQVPQHWLLDLRQSRSSEELRASSLWLPDYRVEIEARPVEGVSDLSALTYDPQRRSLFTVTNRYPELIELSLDGRVLRRIALHGFHDPEAVEYIGPGVLVIADERSQRLIRVRIADDTRELHADRFPELALSIGVNGNKGFEGLAFDPQGRRLFAGKERDPLRIFEVLGFPFQEEDGPPSLTVKTDLERDRRLPLRDLSSLDFDGRTGHLLVLSDQSQLLVELDEQGEVISSLSLRAGRAGLRKGVPQAEGMAVDEAGNLYLVSEPNLFYRFVPVRPQP